MSMALFRKIVDECGQRGAKKILPFLHGESLLVPGILDYFRYVRTAAPQSHINLTTNGSKLCAEKAEIFLQEDLLDSIIVSIDGGEKETFEKIRLGLDYDEIRKNILHFIWRRNQLGKLSPTVSITMVTVEENKQTRKALKEAWSEADDVCFSVYFNWAGKLESKGRTQHKINFCERLNNYITILADGRVAMCCFDSEAEYCVGDIKEQSIYEVWHSKQFNLRRRWMYERSFDQLKLCANCDYINHPSWIMPLVRLRPYVKGAFPQVASVAENLYKRWMIR